jgi:predicted nuclease of predicted toxin-antitoxin system
MKLLIDMNLSPDWIAVFEQQGWEALHWSTVGDPCATDSVIMDWARANGYVVFTHDLDFGTLLATTRVQGPSVIQVRTQDIMPSGLGDRLAQILQQHEAVLEKGALVTVDEARSRVRILPFE